MSEKGSFNVRKCHDEVIWEWELIDGKAWSQLCDYAIDDGEEALINIYALSVLNSFGVFRLGGIHHHPRYNVDTPENIKRKTRE